MREPQGSLVIKTLAMPADTNASGDIFGGWLVSQMDLGGAVLAYELAEGRVVTVAIEQLIFKKPVKVGDTVSCYAACQKRGRTSLTINLEVWVFSRQNHEFYDVAEGTFIFVAVTDTGKPRSLPPIST